MLPPPDLMEAVLHLICAANHQILQVLSTIHFSCHSFVFAKPRSRTRWRERRLQALPLSIKKVLVNINSSFINK
jgi:hypothetical protein